MGALSRRLRGIEGGGIGFWCPGCDCCHQVWVSRPGAGNWGYNGDPEKPTFTPSILVTYNGRDADTADGAPSRCHSYVTDGKIRFLDDSTHRLKGQTVELPDFPGGFDTGP